MDTDGTFELKKVALGRSACWLNGVHSAHPRFASGLAPPAWMVAVFLGSLSAVHIYGNGVFLVGHLRLIKQHPAEKASREALAQQQQSAS